jgi:hypothetical protein
MRNDLELEIKTLIETAISDPKIVVAVADEDVDNVACPNGFNDDDENNIVNRLRSQKSKAASPCKLNNLRGPVNVTISLSPR